MRDWTFADYIQDWWEIDEECPDENIVKLLKPEESHFSEGKATIYYKGATLKPEH